MITKFEKFNEEVVIRFQSDNIIWKDQPLGKFRVGDAVEIIGGGSRIEKMYIGLQGIIMPSQLCIEPNPVRYARPLSVTNADYHFYKGKRSYVVKTRWPDPEGDRYEFWKNVAREEIDPLPDYLRRTEKINPMTFFEVYVSEENLKKIDKKEYLKGLIEYRKRIEEKLREKGLRKEEIRKRMAEIMKDIDPYGEEEWEDTLEHSDYRNVSGYGTMGHSDQQNAGPSFNKGPDAAVFCRPDVIGVASDDIEDPYFADRRYMKMKKIKKNKHIENNRKKKSKYFNSLDKDTLKNKIMK